MSQKPVDAPPGEPSSPRLDPLTIDPDRIEASWYVAPVPSPAGSWRLHSESFILETLQGCLNDPEAVRRTPRWRLLAGAVLVAMDVAQALLMLCSWLPGLSALLFTIARNLPRNALGFFVRGCYWKTRLGRLGVDTMIDQGCDFTRPHAIEIGSRCHIDRNVLMMVGARRGHIRIGDFTNIGSGSVISGRGGVTIGRCVGFSPQVHVFSVSNQPFALDRPGELISMSHMIPARLQSTVEAPVTIEDYAVVGYATLVLPGVTIGRGAIVHAFAEVRDSIPKFGIATGHGKAVRKGWRRPAALDPRLREAASTGSTRSSR